MPRAWPPEYGFGKRVAGGISDRRPQINKPETPVMILRRSFNGHVLLAAAAALGAPLGATAAGFPSKPVTLVVPYPAGGSLDTVARILAKALGAKLGQAVVVDNKAGAGTTIGVGAAAQAAPDGHTLLISSNTSFTINPALKSKLSYDPIKSFDAIGLIGGSPLVMLAHPSVPARSVKEVVALAKSKPGKLTYASFGAGTTAHFAGEMFKVMAGADIVHVPYKGSAPAMQDLIGGQVDLSFDINVAAKPHIEAGKVRAIAVTSRQRTPSLVGVPTFAESGLPDYEMVPWLAMLAPRGLPGDVRQVLVKALADALADPATKAELTKVGVDVEYGAPTAYEPRVAKELPLIRAYVHKAGIVVD
jgi:tripartite-type tricarboxylate transporter receptor subunit TctC